MTSILWVDDLIGVLEDQVEELKVNGFSVATASSGAEALKKIKRRKQSEYQIVIVDMKMPGMDGDEFISRALKQTKNSKFMVLSSYLGDADIRDRIKKLQTRLFIKDKRLGVPGTDEFQRNFIEPLEYLADATPSMGPKTYFKKLERYERRDPFRMKFREFDELPLFVQRNLSRKALKGAKKGLNKLFKQGATWVLVCGSRVDFDVLAMEDENIPDPHIIRKFAKKKDRAYFGIRNPAAIHDVMLSGPCDKIATPRYPTLTMSLGDIKSDPVNIHFDTGSPFTFMDFGFVEQRGALPGNPFWDQLPRDLGPNVENDEIFDVCEFNQQGVIYDQMTSESLKVKIHGLAVDNWIDSSLGRTCKTGCKHFRTGKKTLCLHRFGLIGRDFISKNQMSDERIGIVISEPDCRTSFVVNWSSTEKKKLG